MPALLVELEAPPRLAAHLRLVHDAAAELTDALAHKFPSVPFDSEAVLFGAATHDIGKCVHPAELSGPGSAHEEAGYQLMLGHGIPPHLARFARTHASWSTPGIELEDLLVSLADKAWKAKRVDDLEQLTVAHLAKATARDPWDVFMVLDDILAGVAAGPTVVSPRSRCMRSRESWRAVGASWPVAVSAVAGMGYRSGGSGPAS